MGRTVKKKSKETQLTSWYQPQWLAIGMLVIGLFVLAPHILRLTRVLNNEPLYQVQIDDFRVSKPGPFVPADLLPKTLKKMGYETSVSILDREFLPKFKEELEANAWVAKVYRIQRSLEHGIEVGLEYRSPALMVRTPAGLYPVSGDGVLLPSQDFSPRLVSRFPQLESKEVPAGTREGGHWRDQQVVDAAGLAQVLTKTGTPSLWARCRFREVRAIDQEESRFELIAANRTRVTWGAFGIENELEPNREQKLGRLEKLLGQRNTFEDPRRAYLVDLRRWDVISLEELSGPVLR